MRWSRCSYLLVLLPFVPAMAHALGIRLADPTRFLIGVDGAIFAERVVRFDPSGPRGDTGFDGSAALFAPDDIGFGPEPDSHLVAALGTGGSIELAFESNVVSDGVLAASLDPGSFPNGSEILIFEDGELDGASFYGRLPSLDLVFLGSLAELIVFDPTAPGFGPDFADTVISIDLDAVFDGVVELISIRIVDDGITQADALDTFELDGIANLSPGGPTPAVIPEPGTLGLLSLGLSLLSARRILEAKR